MEEIQNKIKKKKKKKKKLDHERDLLLTVVVGSLFDDCDCDESA
jgi:hypothetical protein